MGCVHFGLAGNNCQGVGKSLAGTYWAVGQGLFLRFFLIALHSSVHVLSAATFLPGGGGQRLLLPQVL